MNQIVFLNDQFLTFEQTHISPNERGFLFSDGLYEVVRSYDGNLFQLEAHLARLTYGLHEMRMPRIDIQMLSEIADQLLEKNNLQQGEALIYLQITRGVAPRAHQFPAAGTKPTVYMAASRFVHHAGEREHGVKIILQPDIRWSRCDLKTIGLIPNVLARQQAIENGAAEALFVRDGVVLEGSHCNFCAIFDDMLFTAPASNYILSGITRNVVLGICEKLKISVKETPIFLNKMKDANELMIVGTTVEITPIIQVDDWFVGDGKPGKITQKLQQSFYDKIWNKSK